MFVEMLAAGLLAEAAPKDQPVVHLPADAPINANRPNKDLGARTPQEWAASCKEWDDWDKPGPPFEIAPRLYYVGTCGITALLVVARDGNVLIDTGTRAGSEIVLANVDKALVEKEWIRLILTSHEHFDHVGGVAYVQKVTGAPALASPVGAAALRSGTVGQDDPQSGMHDPMEPAHGIVPIALGETVSFGGIDFRSISTPGHTPGALSWQWDMCGALSYEPSNDCVSIVYADSLSPVSSDEYRFSDHPEYVGEYRAGLQRLREVNCDILLTPHPSASKMIERAATGSLEGGMSCTQYADAVEKRLDARLAKEAEEKVASQ